MINRVNTDKFFLYTQFSGIKTMTIHVRLSYIN